MRISLLFIGSFISINCQTNFTGTILLYCDMVTRYMIDKAEREVDLIGRHLEIFHEVLENEPIGIVNVGNATGYPNHKVRYSLRVLEEEGLIEPTSQGAVTTEAAEDFLTTHPERIDTLIEQLEESLTGLEPLQA